ncbi:hypothetical protein [Nocardia africana]
MKRYLYRVQIVAYPEGSWNDDEYGSYKNPEWEPEGWDPDDEYIDRFGSSQFFWPKTNRDWKSRSSALKRKRLVESYGATAIIQRSSEIVWPSDGQEYVR